MCCVEGAIGNTAVYLKKMDYDDSEPIYWCWAHGTFCQVGVKHEISV
jgi:hypothetical protein